MNKQESAEQVKKFVNDVRAEINIKQPHIMDVISETNQSRLLNILKDMEHQADQSLIIYRVYAIATPHNDMCTVGTISSLDDTQKSKEEAEKAATKENTWQNNFYKGKPKWSCFISPVKLVTVDD